MFLLSLGEEKFQFMSMKLNLFKYSGCPLPLSVEVCNIYLNTLLALFSVSESSVFYLPSFPPLLHGVTLPRYLVMLGCVFVFVFENLCYSSGNIISVCTDSMGYGPGHVTIFYTAVWVELQWGQGGISASWIIIIYWIYSGF